MRSAVQDLEQHAGTAVVFQGEDRPTERAEIVRSLRERVRRGRYHPADDLVAETLIGWLFLGRPGLRVRTN